jgi:4-amino-4-deoxy-L-arabinose transferase-like glycosyltransferase
MTEGPTAGGEAGKKWGLSPFFHVVLLTALIRGGFLAATPRALDSDPDGYRQLAENLAQRGVFGYGDTPTAYRPPLYPLVLVPLVAAPAWKAAIGALHILMGTAAVGLVYCLAKRWGLRRFAVIAAVFVAVDPLLLVQSTLVMTETLAALLVVVALLALTEAARRPDVLRVALAGGAVALASLCRPTFLPWSALCALVVPWFAETRRKRLKILAVYLLAAAGVFSPWMLRNLVHFGRPIVGTTHGGYTLLLANNPWFYEHLRSGAWGSVWMADELDQWWITQASRATPAKELEADRLAYREAWETIRRQPGMFFIASLIRVAWLWSPLPHRVDPEEQTAEQLARYAVGLWYSVELILAAAGIVAILRRNPQPEGPGPLTLDSRPSTLDSRLSTLAPRPSTTWIWGALLAIVFTAVHSIYWTNLRMRAPIMPVVALAAAAGTARLAGRVPLSRHTRKDL